MQSEYNKRRELLIESLPTNSVTLIFAGREIIKTADEYYKFQVDHNFFYLTGVKQENSILMIIKGVIEANTYLFIDEFDAHKEIWTGIRLKIFETREISGIQNILFTKSFEPKCDLALQEILDSGKACLCLDMQSPCQLEKSISIEQFGNLVKEKYENINLVDIAGKFIEMRMIKSEYEILEIQKAVDITKKALDVVLATIKPGMFEYQISSLFAYQVAQNENAGLAFSTIAASGVNAVILHYPRPMEKMQSGDLLLLDLGADNNEYKSDISRTYPINGKFTDLQKKIYKIVLECNKATIKFVRPGVSILDLQNFACEFMAAELISEGMIANVAEIKKYYYHNISHHLGLDTHDIANREAPLKAGMVITVEPGLYFKEHRIGIRIEDDVLVTENGAICLSKGIIKEINEIEEMMNGHKS